MIRRVLAVTVLTLSLVVLGGTVAETASAQYNPTECRFVTDSPSATAGQTIKISGQGFTPGQVANFTINGIPIASAVADTTGGIDTTAVIPSSLPAGTYEIVVDSCAGQPQVSSIDISGSSANAASGAASSGSTSGSLTSSGADPMPFVKAALLLMAVGGFIVLATKRRDHART